MPFRLSKLQLFLLLGILLPLLVVMVVLYRGGTGNHQGKISVTVDVVPADSSVTANGEKIGTGTVWLKPGNYTFVASKKGFIDAKVEMTISSTSNYVALNPTASSEEAKKWVQENGYEIDGLSSREYEATSAQIIKLAPLLSVLPYTNDDFKITYDYRTNDTASVYIIVTGADADGRTKALQWIRNSGYDPADYVFEFPGQSTPPGAKEETDV
jgi:hypothetical protein